MINKLHKLIKWSKLDMMWYTAPSVTQSQGEGRRKYVDIIVTTVDLSRCAASLGKKEGMATSVSEAHPHLHWPLRPEHRRAVMTATTFFLRASNTRSLKTKATGLPFWPSPARETLHLHTSTKRLFQKPVSTSKSPCMQPSHFLILFSITGARNTSVFQAQKWMPEDSKSCTSGMHWQSKFHFKLNQQTKSHRAIQVYTAQ